MGFKDSRGTGHMKDHSPMLYEIEENGFNFLAYLLIYFKVLELNYIR
jgi:hypothetical protein